MNPEQPSYLRFCPAASEIRRDGSQPYALVTAPSGQVYRLSMAEYEMARVHDGQRDAQRRQEAAAEQLGTAIDSRELTRFTADLVETGLLEAGSEEPLPPPRQLADQISDRDPRDGGESFPPSSVPGSLGNPGRQGPIGGGGSHAPGEGSAPRLRLPGKPLEWLGHLLNQPLYHRPLQWALWLLVVAALYGLWHNRLDAARDATQLLAPYRLVFVGMLSALLVNLTAQAARAAAIARYTGESPACGIDFALRIIPRLHTSTEGPAERADLTGRLRILGSPLSASLLVFVLAIGGWLMVRESGTFLPTLLLGLGMLSMAGFLLRLNPLARRDGYFLLAHRLRVPDLRDQAWIALFGYERPWHQEAPPPRAALRLYILAVIAYVALVVTLLLLYPARWLGAYFGGTGIAIFAVLMGIALWEQTRRTRSDRGRIEPMRLRLQTPTRPQWLLLGLLALAALFPYTYEPSGRVIVLPAERADIRALVSGDVREVLVSEGDTVEAGQEIVRLGDRQQKSQVEASEARIRQLEAELRLLDAGAAEEEIALAEQRVATAQERLQFAQSEAERAEKAYRRGAIPPQEFESARANANVRREELAEAEHQLAVVERQAREDERATLEAELDAERAKLVFLRSQLENTRVRSPIAGRVVSESLMFALGSYLDAGDLVATVQEQDRLMAELHMPESTISEVELGAPARVRTWTAPGTSVPGQVTHIAPNVQEERYGKIVRVLVRLDGGAGAHLKPEMTGRAKIEGNTYPAIVVFTRALTRLVMVEAWSWLP